MPYHRYIGNLRIHIFELAWWLQRNIYSAWGHLLLRMDRKYISEWISG
jgi:hypothetical protein